MNDLAGARAIAGKLTELAGIDVSEWQVYRLAKRRNSPIGRDPDGNMLSASSAMLSRWWRRSSYAPIFAKQVDRRRQSRQAARVDDEIQIFGVIGDGDLTDSGFTQTLTSLGNPKNLRVKINSDGGIVSHGLAIYNALRTHPARVEVDIVGVAASMASAIAMAGDKVSMAEDGLFMLHDPWAGAAGNADDLRAAADMLDKFGGSLAAIYARKSGLKEAQVEEMMGKDGGEGTWLNAREALDLGFIDEILSPASAKLPKLPAAALAKRIIRRGDRKMNLKRKNQPKTGKLVSALTAAIAALVTDDTTEDDVVNDLAAAADTDDKAVKAILGGDLKGVTKDVLDAFAETLEVEADDLVEAAQADGVEIKEEDPAPAPTARASAVERAVKQALDRQIAARAKMTADVQARAPKLGIPEAAASEIASQASDLADANARMIKWLADPKNQNRISNVNGNVIAGDDDRDKWLDGMEQWLLIKSGNAGLIKAHAKKTEDTVVKLDPGQFRGFRLIDIARDVLEREGISVRGMSPLAIAKRALQPRADSSGLGTRSDFPVLLENVLHKLLLAAYETAASQWRSVAAVGSVQDFRAHPRLRLGSLPRLSTLLESGEFRQMHFPDAQKESIQAATFGNIIGLSRQAIVNDDVDGFTRLTTMLGMAADRSVEIDVFALFALNSGLGPTLLDGDTLFHANHSNIDTTAAAPSVDSFEASRVLMAQQKDPSDEDFLNLRPDVWVGPIGKGAAARVAINAEFDFNAGGATPKFMKPNVVRDLLSTIVDTPRLAGNRWYLLGSPAIAPVFEVVFLEGQESPVIEVEEGFDYDGVRWKIRHDYGTGATDFRGATTNAGA